MSLNIKMFYVFLTLTTKFGRLATLINDLKNMYGQVNVNDKKCHFYLLLNFFHDELRIW